MQGIHTKQVAKYVILPGIVPRAKALASSGFGYIAFLMANIYAMVRLLPAGHAYLNPDNIGRFGLRHVITEAANHLVIKKSNIDQIIVFAAMVIAMILLFLQFGAVIYSLILQPLIGDAFAVGLFGTQYPNTDIAFMLLDHVFGIPDMFNSCVSFGPVCEGMPDPRGAFPVPFQIGLQSLFQFYSSALLVVAIFIFLYFLVVVVVETATTGTPFGNRFASVWVPIRLVVALGLLLPVGNYGYNSGQYIALTAAKMGSGFATNAWLRYNKIVKANTVAPNIFNPMGEPTSNLIGKPTAPEVSSLVASMALIHACAYSYMAIGTTDGIPANPEGDVLDDGFIKPYFVKLLPGPDDDEIFQEVTEATTYKDGLKFYDNGDIIIRWGEHSPENYEKEKGNVFPYCGEIKIKVSDLSQLSGNPNQQASSLGGPIAILEGYFETINVMWQRGYSKHFRAFAYRIVQKEISGAPSPCDNWCELGDIDPSTQTIDPDTMDIDPDTGEPIPGTGEIDPDSGVPFDPNIANCTDKVTDPDSEYYDELLCKLEIPAGWKKNVIQTINSWFVADVHSAWATYATNGAGLEMEQETLDRGWGGAGIWYNKLAGVNGNFITAVLDVPELITYPDVMKQVRDIKRTEDANVNSEKQFCPDFSSGPKTLVGNSKNLEVARTLCEVFKFLKEDGIFKSSQNIEPTGQNIFKSAMNLLFGTNGLFEMRENQNTHPLVQLVSVGKGLVESAVRNMAISSALSFGGGMAGAMQVPGAGMASAWSDFFLSTAFMGLTAGFVLFYVLPFLPFLYFFFAVASWLKTIFEAMVGIPLWALAHLRIDGEGLPGKSAENGYFLILEIFLRPILSVFGLIAAFAIFGAQVRVLNFLWDQVVSNVTGFNERDIGALGITKDLNVERGIVDQFFFTIIYTIIVYMLAMASFKLIDRIPDNILRWLGSQAAAYSDVNNETEIEGLGRQVGTAGLTHGQTFVGGIKDASKGLGKATGEAINLTPEGQKGLAQRKAQAEAQAKKGK